MFLFNKIACYLVYRFVMWIFLLCIYFPSWWHVFTILLVLFNIGIVVIFYSKVDYLFWCVCGIFLFIFVLFCFVYLFCRHQPLFASLLFNHMGRLPPAPLRYIFSLSKTLCKKFFFVLLNGWTKMGFPSLKEFVIQMVL